MKKVVVIGCGNVGLSYVEKLATQINIQTEIVLIDLAKEKIEGEVLDLEQGLTLLNPSVRLKVGNYCDVEDADIVSICAGLPQKFNDRLDDLEGASKIIEDIVTHVMENHFQGIFLIASNPLDVITQLVAHYADYPYQKVIGTGTMLDTARLRSILSKKLDISAEYITAYVLGEHGNSQFVAWNNANVGLQNLNSFLSVEEKDLIAEEVKHMGKTIISKKSHTDHGVASCLVRLSLAILLDENCVYPVSCYHEQYDVYLSTPAVIGKDGIIRRIDMKLTEEENKKLLSSAGVIKQAVEKILPVELY